MRNETGDEPVSFIPPSASPIFRELQRKMGDELRMFLAKVAR